MSWLKAGQIAFMAYEAMKGYVQKTTEQEIRAVVIQLVKERLDQLVQEINRRSFVYLILSVISLVVYILGQIYPQYPLPYILALLLLLAISLYLLSKTVIMIRRWLGYLENLEQLIDDGIREKLKQVGDQSLYKKALVWLSERSQADYRDQVIVEIVRSISSWLRQNKSILIVRFVFMWILMLIFIELMQKLFARYL
jgi:hypothetical protein